MKISKKIALIFISANIIIIMLCAGFSWWMIKILTLGEVDRAYGRTNSINSVYNEFLENINVLGDEFRNCIKFLYYNKKENNNIFLNKIFSNFDEKFKKQNINYAILYDKKTNKFYNINLQKPNFNELIHNNEIKKLISFKNDKVGTLVYKNRIYMIDIKKISLNDGKELGDTILIKELGQEFIQEMKSISKKDSGITIDFKPLKDPAGLVGKDKQPFYYKTEGNIIKSYVRIKTLNENVPVYVTLTEERGVNEKNKEVIGTFIIILVVIIIFINIIVYNLIKQKVLKRVSNINNEVNKIIGTKDLNITLKEDNKGDEISCLTKDINLMIYNIREVNIRLDNNRQLHKNLLESMSNAFIYLSIEKDDLEYRYKILEINYAAKKLFKISEDVQGKYFSDQTLKVNNEIIEFIDKSVLCKKTVNQGEFMILKDIWCDIYLQIENNNISLILNDITDLKRYSEEMRYLANYDTLTGIFNRHKIMDYLTDITNEEKEYSIFFIDLDNFKGLNDNLGHHTGDKILCAVSQALNVICEEDTINVGRLGGDEFIVIRQGKNTESEIESISKNILETLNSVIRINNLTFELSGSIGVSYYPQHSTDLSEVLQYADIAMYESKEKGGNQYSIFSSKMMERIELQNRIKAAIENDDFEIFYQPIYDMKKGKITGGEALIRWFSEDGIIMPDKFISIAKKTGDIIDIDKLVFEKAIKYCSDIVKEYDDFTVSVNLSYRFLKQDNFIDTIKEILKKNNLKPSYLRVEVTEDEFIEDTNETSRILNELRKIGIRISLDDFGTGYSSFNYLKQLPVDVIKIDRSIVSRLGEDIRSLNIIGTLIKLCHDLNFSVVCEGVEYKEEIILLSELQCDKIQGYYISKPVDGESFKKLLNNMKI